MALALTILGGLPAQAQDMFVLLRGADTIAVERVARSPSRLDGEVLSRPLGLRFSYALTLADGSALKFENEFRRPTDSLGSPPVQRAVMAFATDSVLVHLTNAGGDSTTQRLATRAGALPYLNPSFALIEPALSRLRTARTDSLVVPYFLVQGGATIDVRLARRGADTVAVSFGPGQDLLAVVDADGTLRGGAVPAQGLRLVRAPFTGEAFFVPKPDYSAPPGAPYTAHEVRIPTPAGHVLAGTLTLPHGRGPFPAVVTITGSGLQDRDQEIPLVPGYRPFRQIADTLGRMGIAVLRLDDRGFGESGGNAATATSRDLAEDIKAGLAWLRSRPDIDPRRLGLIGHSEGGLIGPLIAAEDSSLRALVIMAGPARPGREIIRYQQQYAIEHSSAIRPEARDSALRAAQAALDSAAAQPWLRYFLDYDPLPTARRVRTPTLILHGATDRQVTVEQAELLADAIRAGGNSDVTVEVFPETNHLFQHDPSGNPTGYSRLPGRIRPEVIARLTGWLARVFFP
jgi:dienelactone hydrolase